MISFLGGACRSFLMTRGLPQPARRLGLEHGFLAAMIVISGILAVLQYRWTGRLAEAELAGQQTLLENRAQTFAETFDRELSALVPAADSDSTGPGARRREGREPCGVPQLANEQRADDLLPRRGDGAGRDRARRFRGGPGAGNPGPDRAARGVVGADDKSTGQKKRADSTVRGCRGPAARVSRVRGRARARRTGHPAVDGARVESRLRAPDLAALAGRAVHRSGDGRRARRDAGAEPARDFFDRQAPGGQFHPRPVQFPGTPRREAGWAPSSRRGSWRSVRARNSCSARSAGRGSRASRRPRSSTS